MAHLQQPAGGMAANEFCFQLTLVRHGETEDNRKKIIQGQANTPLSEHGRSQARLAARHLVGEEFDEVYSSDLSRARETAEIIVAEQSVKTAITEDALLRERCFGVLEGSSYSDYFTAVRSSGVSAPLFVPEGGEPMDQLNRRAAGFFDAICQKFLQQVQQQQQQSDERPVPAVFGPILERYLRSGGRSPLHPRPSSHMLVVAHGGIIRETFLHLQDRCGCSFPAGAMSTTPNTGVSSLLVSLDTTSTPASVLARVVCLHDATHLQPASS